MMMVVQVQSSSLRDDHITVGSNRYPVDAEGNAYVSVDDAKVLVEHIGFARVRDLDQEDIPRDATGEAPRTWQDFLAVARKLRMSPGDLRRMASVLEAEQTAQAAARSGTIPMPATTPHKAPKPAEPVANVPPPPEPRKAPKPVAPEFEVVDWTQDPASERVSEVVEAEAELSKGLEEPAQDPVPEPVPEPMPEPVPPPSEVEVEVEVSMKTPRHKLQQVAKAMGLKFSRKATKAKLLEMIEGHNTEE